MKINLTQIQSVNGTPIHTIGISPNNEQFVVGQQGNEAEDANLTLWSINMPKLLLAIHKQIYTVIYKARYSFTGDHLAFVDSAGQVAFYEFESNSTKQLDLNNPNIRWIDYAKKCNRLVISGKFTQVWDTDYCKVIWKGLDIPNYQASSDAIASAISSNGEQVAVSGVESNRILIYDVEQNNLAQVLEGGPNYAHWLSFDSNSKYIAAIGSYSHGTFLWNLNNGEKYLPHIFTNKIRGYWCLSFTSDGEHMALGMLSGYVVVIRLKDGEIVFEQKLHTGRVWDIAFTTDSRYLISGGEDGVIHLLAIDWTHT